MVNGSRIQQTGRTVCSDIDYKGGEWDKLTNSAPTQSGARYVVSGG